jgi:adenine-specific DNA methylase
MKKCTKCGKTKPLTEFWKDRSKKHGYSARCKPCKTAAHGIYRKVSGYDRIRYWRDPAGERERHLVRKYGITQANYDAMFKAQDGKCAVCRKEQARAFDVDHDHVTGMVRGLLCTSCNRMIGHAGDSSARLKAAAKYLQSCRKSRRSSSERT